MPEDSRPRRAAGWVLLLVAAGLIPWTAFLAVSLPDEHLATNWALVWTGFDLALTALIATAALALRRRWPSAPLLVMGIAVALCCDAWFDVLTASGDEQAIAIALAVLVEVPVAVLCAWLARRLLPLRP